MTFDNSMPAVEIVRMQRGYFALYVDGLFGGNFDSYAEAAQEVDRLLYPDAENAG